MPPAGNEGTKTCCHVEESQLRFRHHNPEALICFGEAGNCLTSWYRDAQSSDCFCSYRKTHCCRLCLFDPTMNSRSRSTSCPAVSKICERQLGDFVISCAPSSDVRSTSWTAIPNVALRARECRLMAACCRPQFCSIHVFTGCNAAHTGRSRHQWPLTCR